jgi:hypothetical protein
MTNNDFKIDKMKKIIGWVLIILCSIFLLFFAISLITIISGILTKNSDIQMSINWILNSLIGYLILITLLIFGLRNGIKKLKNDKATKIIGYDKVMNIKLAGQIEYADYRNLILGLSFKKPTFFVMVGILILFSFIFLVNSENMMNKFDSNYFIFIILGIFLLSPIFTLIQIRRLYRTNRIFQERLNYSLTNDSINIKGNAVDSTQKWTCFYQIRETKNFFMFYHGKMVATLLDKKMFSDSELQDFKEFIKSLNIKKA